MSGTGHQLWLSGRPSCLHRHQALPCRTPSPVTPARDGRSHLCIPCIPSVFQQSYGLCTTQTAFRHRDGVSCQSSSTSTAGVPSGPPNPDLGPPAPSKQQTTYLGILFGGWYLFNIFFNLYNKQVLKVYPYPISCTNLQFGVGSLIALTTWALSLHERPKVSKDLIVAILPLAAVHTLGNLLTNVSLGAVAVSFTHTIKAMEPFFSVLLSALFLGDRPTVAVLATLVPIVGGVALASASEVTFNWLGFLSAMGSNLTFQSRNVFSKKFMGSTKVSLDNINLFSIITILAFFLLLPVTLLTEGARFTPDAIRAAGIADTNGLLRRAALAGVCFHLYQQVSYMILQRVSPVTHSIGNCLKRVIVIVASVIIFQNPMSQRNQLGTAIALAGVFAYSQVKRLSGKAKRKVPPS